MAMAKVMSGMPDVWRRVLAEHVPDQGGRCKACHDERGGSASWPCLTRQIAEQAKQIHDNPPPEFPPQQSAQWQADSTLDPSQPRAALRSVQPPSDITSDITPQGITPQVAAPRSTGRHAAP